MNTKTLFKEDVAVYDFPDLALKSNAPPIPAGFHTSFLKGC